MVASLHHYSTNITNCMSLFHMISHCYAHEQNTYMKTKEKADKLKIHIMCLAMVLAGCRLDFATLAAELKLEPSSVSVTTACYLLLSSLANTSIASLLCSVESISVWLYSLIKCDDCNERLLLISAYNFKHQHYNLKSWRFVLLLLLCESLNSRYRMPLLMVSQH
jgi:A49-like RNA polymerase I associated factor